MTDKIIQPYKIGLALSGGGAKGFAHLGVLEALNERNIKPEIISGTSAGAIAGALYADGHAPREIAEMFKNKGFTEFVKISVPQAGLFKSNGVSAFLKKHLRAKTFEQLPIPLNVTATDISEGVSVHFDKGELVSAIIASCTFPIVFSPKEIEGCYYVDGGIFMNFPVSPIRDKCQKVIGVNVSPMNKQKYKNSMLHIAERSFHYMSTANTIPHRELCDVLIESNNLSEYPTFDLEHVDEIFEIGYKIACEVLDREEELLKKEKQKIEKNHESYENKNDDLSGASKTIRERLRE